MESSYWGGEWGASGYLGNAYHLLGVYFSGLQYMWNLTDEWANFMLAYETDLY